jgi:hypothetical protein
LWDLDQEYAMDQTAAKASAMFQPIPAQRAFEVVCERIRELVASGRLKKGASCTNTSQKQSPDLTMHSRSNALPAKCR